MHQLLLTAILLSFSHVTLADKILVLIPSASKSHHILGEALSTTLAKKGHQVSLYTVFPSGKNMENYTEVYLDGLLEYKQQEMKDIVNFNSSHWRMLLSLERIRRKAEVTLESRAIQSLIKSNATFDLMIVDIMFNDALLGLGYHFKTPVIGLSSMGTTEFLNLMLGNPAPSAYVPNLFQAFTQEMNFFQRVLNTLTNHLCVLLVHCFFRPVHDRVLHRTFPDAPPLVDLIHNISLMLFNTHYSLESPRPYMPNMIQVGGFHILDEKLPKELKSILDEAKEGVVLFSLGSNLKSSDLPKEKLETILKAIGKYPVTFLWKFEKDLLNVPKNVKIMKWVPQQAVLAHPNTRAFITHGGLLSTIEAVYFGVPFIGIPAFADQKSNVARAVRRQYGLQLDMNELTEETLIHALDEVLNNSKYEENIKKLSTLLREQPLHPMETAVYWIEHVLEHKGSPHLQNAGLKLSWYQYYLIDVAAFLFAVLSVILWINYYIFKKTVRFITRNVFRTLIRVKQISMF